MATKMNIEAYFDEVMEKEVWQSGNKRMTAVFVPKEWVGKRVLVLLLPKDDEEDVIK